MNFNRRKDYGFIAERFTMSKSRVQNTVLKGKEKAKNQKTKKQIANSKKNYIIKQVPKETQYENKISNHNHNVDPACSLHPAYRTAGRCETDIRSNDC